MAMATKNPTRASSRNRAALIAAVRSPLNFFTLGILVTEGIILALAYKATGLDFTLLVIGALVGLLLLIVVVFVLVLNPNKQNALLGIADEGITGRVRALELSDNDIRFLINLKGGSFLDQFQPLPNVGGVKILEDRAAALAKKGLVSVSKGSGRVYYRPTRNGFDLIGLIQDLVRPLTQDS
jgi:hypothetical protein